MSDMFKKSDKTPVVGSYVKWTEGDKEFRGQVTEIANSTVKVQPENLKDDIVTKTLTDLEVSYSTAMKMGLKNNAIEVAENVVANSLILRGFGHAFSGHDSISFAIADAAWEFFLKDLAAPMADMLVAQQINVSDENADSLFKMTDLKDMARKLPFTWLLTQTVKKLMYKKKFFDNAVTNLGSQAGALYATNVIDRKFRFDKVKGYRYP